MQGPVFMSRNVLMPYYCWTLLFYGHNKGEDDIHIYMEEVVRNSSSPQHTFHRIHMNHQHARDYGTSSTAAAAGKATHPWVPCTPHIMGEHWHQSQRRKIHGVSIEIFLITVTCLPLCLVAWSIVGESLQVDGRFLQGQEGRSKYEESISQKAGMYRQGLWIGWRLSGEDGGGSQQVWRSISHSSIWHTWLGQEAQSTRDTRHTLRTPQHSPRYSTISTDLCFN